METFISRGVMSIFVCNFDLRTEIKKHIRCRSLLSSDKQLKSIQCTKQRSLGDADDFHPIRRLKRVLPVAPIASYLETDEYQKPKKTGEPQKGKDTGELQKGKGTGEPQKGKDTGEPQKGKGTGEPEKGKDTGEPEKGKDTDEPEKGKDTGEPQKGKDTGEPQKGKDTGEPQKGKDTGEPQKGKDTGEPQKGKGTGEPQNGKETGEPQKGKDTGDQEQGKKGVKNKMEKMEAITELINRYDNNEQKDAELMIPKEVLEDMKELIDFMKELIDFIDFIGSGDDQKQKKIRKLKCETLVEISKELYDRLVFKKEQEKTVADKMQEKVMEAIYEGLKEYCDSPSQQKLMEKLIGEKLQERKETDEPLKLSVPLKRMLRMPVECQNEKKRNPPFSSGTISQKKYVQIAPPMVSKVYSDNDSSMYEEFKGMTKQHLGSFPVKEISKIVFWGCFVSYGVYLCVPVLFPVLVPVFVPVFR